MSRSIMTQMLGVCYICGQAATEVHHVFYGTANRRLSEKHGLTVPLCSECHRGNRGVHHNRELDLQLKRAGQAAWELKNDATTEEFVKIFGKNYL